MADTNTLETLINLSEEQLNARDAALEKLSRIKQNTAAAKAMHTNSRHISPYQNQRDNNK